MPGKSCCAAEDRDEGSGDVHICMKSPFSCCSQVKG